MFEGFERLFVDVGEGKIFCLRAGAGFPLLLLHGYPQTHLMWHKTAPGLARDFTVVVADLRGYGASMAPPSAPDHSPYSKRAMADDMVRLMDDLGFDSFFIAGHDRGGRVAHRLARDRRDRVRAMAVLDICPTLDMYEATDMDFASAYFHWFFLTQPPDIPERMIGSDPRAWMKLCLQNWSDASDFGPLEDMYSDSFRHPERIRASCEDYRASATIDLEHDRADRHRPVDIPLHVLWGERGVVGRKFHPLKIWQRYTTAPVTGRGLPCGHFVPEECPEETVAELKGFFSAAGGF